MGGGGALDCLEHESGCNSRRADPPAAGVLSRRSPAADCMTELLGASAEPSAICCRPWKALPGRHGCGCGATRQATHTLAGVGPRGSTRLWRPHPSHLRATHPSPIPGACTAEDCVVIEGGIERSRMQQSIQHTMTATGETEGGRRGMRRGVSALGRKEATSRKEFG